MLRIPPAVYGLTAVPDDPAPGSLSFFWESQGLSGGSSTTHDVVRGSLSALHTGGFPGGAACVESALPAPPYTESASACPAAPGDGCWYLIRGSNPCGLGTFGAIALDASDFCL